MCKLLAFEKTRNTRLHALSDGHVEHYNVTVVKVFGCTIFNERKVGIPSYISSVFVVRRNLRQTKKSKGETDGDSGRSSEAVPRSCFKEVDFLMEKGLVRLLYLDLVVLKRRQVAPFWLRREEASLGEV